MLHVYFMYPGGEFYRITVKILCEKSFKGKNMYGILPAHRILWILEHFDFRFSDLGYSICNSIFLNF